MKASLFSFPRHGSGQHPAVTCLEVLHTANRAHVALHASPLSVASVLSPFQKPLAPPVVGVLVEDPGSLEHLAGVDFPIVPALMERRHVVCQFNVLALKVRPLPHFHSPGVSHLKEHRQNQTDDELHFIQWSIQGRTKICLRLIYGNHHSWVGTRSLTDNLMVLTGQHHGAKPFVCI